MTTPRGQHPNPLINFDPLHLDNNGRPIFTLREIETLKAKNITYDKDHPAWAVFNYMNKDFRDNHFTSGPNWNMAAAARASRDRDKAFEAAIASLTPTSGGYKKRRRGKVTRHRRSKRRNSRNSRRVRRN